MEAHEYERMHALENDYWWFVGRREVIASLLRQARRRRKNAPREYSRGAPFDVLDLGCGTGANLPMLRDFAGENGSVVGVDFSPLALRFAAAQLEKNQSESREYSRVAMLRGDAVHLPLRDASFDAVTMFDVLEHIEDAAGALRESHRVLWPGGALVLSVPAYKKLWSAHDEALHHFRRYEKHELHRALKSAGFRTRILSFSMSAMPPLAWAFRRFVLPLRQKNRAVSIDTLGAVLPAVPPFLNRALISYLRAEGKIIPHRPLRFGTSLVALAIKE